MPSPLGNSRAWSAGTRAEDQATAVAHVSLMPSPLGSSQMRPAGTAPDATCIEDVVMQRIASVPAAPAAVLDHLKQGEPTSCTGLVLVCPLV